MSRRARKYTSSRKRHSSRRSSARQPRDGSITVVVGAATAGALIARTLADGVSSRRGYRGAAAYPAADGRRVPRDGGGQPDQTRVRGGATLRARGRDRTP